MKSKLSAEVETAIAKWSMADVFVVALFIAFLAAKATQSSGDPAAPPLVAFDAHAAISFRGGIDLRG